MEHTADDKAKTIWINGSLIDEDKAHVSVFDHGLLTGDGVFETMIAYNSVPFAFTRHYNRLKNQLVPLVSRSLNLNCLGCMY